MTYHLRPYTGPSDQPAMLDLALACQDATLHVTDLPYRLSSWGLDCPENIGQWVDEAGQLAAWAILQTPFWAVDIVLPSALDQELLPVILEWADQHATACRHTRFGLPSWYVNVFAYQANLRRILEHAGFADQSNLGAGSWRKVWLEREVKLPVPEYPTPRGFTIRSLSGPAEVPAYVDLHQATFGTKNMTVEWRRRTLEQPQYNPELDVVVEAPNGRLGAWCIGWISTAGDGTRCGQIEPLGCHPDYRSYALGRLALCETLRRLIAHGTEKIYTETDNYRDTAFRLYESLGFTVSRQVAVYRKDYNSPID